MAMPYFLLVAIGSYSLMAFTSWEVWRELHNFEKDMSKPTREMNIQLTKVLLAQALIPFVFSLAPGLIIFGGWMVSAVVGSSIMLHGQRTALVLKIFMSFICVVDPLAAILIVPGYRRELLKGFVRM